MRTEIGKGETPEHVAFLLTARKEKRGNEKKKKTRRWQMMSIDFKKNKQRTAGTKRTGLRGRAPAQMRQKNETGKLRNSA